MGLEYYNFTTAGLSTAVDLTGYEGREVTVSAAGVVAPISDTNQATTEDLYPDGILVQGCEAGEVPQVMFGIGVYTRAIAGTGGVTKGAQVVPEYAASGLDRGRFIAITPSVNAWVRGDALTAASEDEEFVLLWHPHKLNVIS